MMGLDEVPSPCAAVCRMNEGSGLCEGCWRTLEEITQWAHADEDEKRDILARIDERRTGQAA